MKINEALETISKALGITHRNSCNCEACAMKTVDQKRKDVASHLTTLKLVSNAAFVAAVDAALGLKANAGLGAKHLKMLEELDERGLDMMSAMIEAYKSNGPKAAEGDEDEQNEDDERREENRRHEDEDDPNAMRKQNRRKGMTAAEIDKLVANRVDEVLRRREVVAKLKANEANPFSDDELQSLPIAALEKVEQKLRPVDYSGAGGFAINHQRGTDEDDAPLRINRGVLSDPPKKDAA